MPSRANNGSTSVFRKFRPSRISAASRISRSHGQKDEHVPLRNPCRSGNSIPRPTKASSGSSSFPGRKNSDTGNIRPSASITGTSYEAAPLPSAFPEEIRKRTGIQGRRGNHHPKVLPASPAAGFKYPNREIDIQGALMRLIQDQRIIFRKSPIPLRLRKQNAIRP